MEQKTQGEHRFKQWDSLDKKKISRNQHVSKAQSEEKKKNMAQVERLR